jgi:hypothetical protein
MGSDDARQPRMFPDSGLTYAGGRVEHRAMRGILMAALLALGGCSFMFVEGPAPDRDVRLPPRCTTSYGWPVLDAVFGGLSGAAALTLIMNRDTLNRDPGYQPALVGNLAGWAIHSLASAVGESQVKRCRRAVTAWETAQLAPPPAAAPEPALYCYKPGEGSKVLCYESMEQCRDGWDKLRQAEASIRPGMRPCRAR